MSAIVKIIDVNNKIITARALLDTGASAHFISIHSLYSKFQKTLTFLTIPTIAESIPTENFPRKSISISSNCQLADPEFHISRLVDLLIGSGATQSMLSIGQI